jgi:hypothetical protein
MSNHYGVTSTGRVPGPVIEQLREQIAIAVKANADLEAENARVKLERDEAQAANAELWTFVQFVHSREHAINAMDNEAQRLIELGLHDAGSKLLAEMAAKDETIASLRRDNEMERAGWCADRARLQSDLDAAKREIAAMEKHWNEYLDKLKAAMGLTLDAGGLELLVECESVKKLYDETATLQAEVERLTKQRNDADADGGRLLVRAERAEHDRDAARRELVAMTARATAARGQLEEAALRALRAENERLNHEKQEIAMTALTRDGQCMEEHIYPGHPKFDRMQETLTALKEVQACAIGLLNLRDYVAGRYRRDANELAREADLRRALRHAALVPGDDVLNIVTGKRPPAARSKP